MVVVYALAVFAEKIVVEVAGDAEEEFCVEAVAVEDAVGVGALYANGFGKVFHCFALTFEYRKDFLANDVHAEGRFAWRQTSCRAVVEGWIRRRDCTKKT